MSTPMGNEGAGRNKVPRTTKNSNVPPASLLTSKAIPEVDTVSFPWMSTGNIPEALPQFQLKSDVIEDVTSPLSIHYIEELANRIVNVVPGFVNPEAQSSGKKQTKEEVKNIAQSVAAKFGYILDPSYLEDLFVISANECPLTDQHVWMYLRGASRTSQILMAMFSKAMTSIEAVLQKNQQAMMTGTEQSKLTTDRLNVISKHIESLPAAIGALIKHEHSITREKITTHVQRPSVYAATLVPSSSTVAAETQYPSASEIKEILTLIKCPPESLEVASIKLMGKITWDHYNSIMSGKITPSDAKKFIFGLRKKPT